MTQHEMVKEFHERFSVTVAQAPRELSGDEFSFRFKFLHEELREFDEAYRRGDLVKQADALLDLAYVVHGTALMMGLPWDDMFALVHEANMRKVSAREAGVVGRHPLDVVKPAGWVGPEDGLAALLDASA